MKKAFISAVVAAALLVPAQGSGSVPHNKHHYLLRVRMHVHLPKTPKPTKWDGLYKEFADLRAEPGALQGQNKIADDFGIRRALTREDYNEKIADGELVNFPKKIGCVVVDSRLSLKPFLVVSAPQVIDYITTELAPAFCDSSKGDFESKPMLVISSLTRTLEYQRILAKRNLAARSALGDDDPNRRSSHSTGVTVDFSLAKLRYEAVHRLAAFLEKEKQPGGHLAAAYLEARGDHFHVMVCPNFPIPCIDPTPPAEVPIDEEKSAAAEL